MHFSSWQRVAMTFISVLAFIAFKMSQLRGGSVNGRA